MQVNKFMADSKPTLITQNELDDLNRFTKRTLTADEVYIFSVLLCDNEVDRDFERFTEQTLAELKELFVGKTGISDHSWQSGAQKTRIYRTELVRDAQKKCSDGSDYIYIRAYVYMLKTEANTEFIAEIEGGIKKEVSVGCSIARSVCSVCREDYKSAACPHEKGKAYSAKLCFAELVGAVDAYEWSFVAVPAQRSAGVLKKLSQSHFDGDCSDFAELKKLADIGRAHLDSVRAEVLRLALLHDKNMHRALKDVAKSMDLDALSALKVNFETQLEQKFPPTCQIPNKQNSKTENCDEYRV